MNNLYGGMITPHWNQIDKIHIGPAATLNPNDEILLGRYVLVKYLENIIYSQDSRYAIQIATFEEDSEESPEKTWQQHYKTDGQDYDGVVFIKQLNQNKELTYTPVARINTSLSEQFVFTALEPIKERATVLEERATNLEARATDLEGRATDLENQVSTLIGEDDKDLNKSVRTIATEEVAKIVAGAPENLNDLKEISDWIAKDEKGAAAMNTDITNLKTDTGDLKTRMSTAESNINSLDIRMGKAETSITKLNNIKIVMEVDTLPDPNNPDDPNKDKFSLNIIYSIPYTDQTRELIIFERTETGYVKNSIGYTAAGVQTSIAWQPF